MYIFSLFPYSSRAGSDKARGGGGFFVIENEFDWKIVAVEMWALQQTSLGATRLFLLWFNKDNNNLRPVSHFFKAANIYLVLL